MAYAEFRKITILRLRKPTENNVNADMQWLSNSLGLVGLRDKSRSCYRVFIELLKAAKKGQSLSSDEISFHTSLSRGTVVHHLNKLMAAGIVAHDGSRYALRVRDLKQLVHNIREDLNNSLAEIEEIAAEIDRQI
jgi:predicted transcriptional regulator